MGETRKQTTSQIGSFSLCPRGCLGFFLFEFNFNLRFASYYKTNGIMTTVDDFKCCHVPWVIRILPVITVSPQDVWTLLRCHFRVTFVVLVGTEDPARKRKPPPPLALPWCPYPHAFLTLSSYERSPGACVLELFSCYVYLVLLFLLIHLYMLPFTCVSSKQHNYTLSQQLCRLNKNCYNCSQWSQ